MIQRRPRALVHTMANQAIADSEDGIRLWARHIAAADDLLDTVVACRHAALSRSRALAGRMSPLEAPAPTNDTPTNDDPASNAARRDHVGGAP